MRLLRTIGGVDVTRQERATLNKLTMPGRGCPTAWLRRPPLTIHSPMLAGFLVRNLRNQGVATTRMGTSTTTQSEIRG